MLAGPLVASGSATETQRHEDFNLGGLRVFAAWRQSQAPAPSGTATVTAIQIHGNVLTPDDDVRRLAGVAAGMPFDASTIDAVTARLRAAKRFKSVQVLKRFASIADPSQIVLVVIVDE